MASSAWDMWVTRLDADLAEEERRGLHLAAQVRIGVTVIVMVWLALTSRFGSLAYLYALACIVPFLLLGVLQLRATRRAPHSRLLPFMVAAVDAALLVAVFCVPNPFLERPLPPAYYFQGSEFLFVVTLLVLSVFGYSVALVLWTGFTLIAAWTAAVLYTAALPEVVTDRGIGDDIDTLLAAVYRPEFLSLAKWGTEVVLGTLVTLGLAAAVRRSRRLVARRSAAERARANIARYVPPGVADELALRDEPLGPGRRQTVAVLFADIVGFTGFAERLPPEAALALLREFHGRMAAVVFDHGGMLDRIMGDGLMATFGVARGGDEGREPVAALACARAMLADLEVWNAGREAAGEARIEVGVGVHYGPAVVGDIGGEHGLTFTVIGDTVNAAARLQALTRDYGVPLIASAAVVEAARAAGAGAGVFDGMRHAGMARLRGRVEPLPVVVLGEAFHAQADEA